MSGFEYDLAKSEANLAKHGIDFDAAQGFWDDPDLIGIPASVADEPRYLVVARLGRKHWSAVITY